MKKIALGFVLLYIFLVPVLPFQGYFSGNFWSQGARDTVCPGPVWFKAFSTPAGASSRPLPSSSYVVFGSESLSASAFDFGLVVSNVCGFTALTVSPGLVPQVPIILFLTLVSVAGFLYMVIRRGRRRKIRKRRSEIIASPSAITKLVQRMF